MSPHNIVERALARGLDMIAVTDHNSGRQCRVVQKAGADRGLAVLCGVEINTREEVHCLAYFSSLDQLDDFDRFLYRRLADIANQPEKFGYQAVVDKQERIIDQPEKLLISAVDLSVGEVEKQVHELGGLFVPAHIDRMRNGIIAQLGFVPPDLSCDALEISRHTSREAMIAKHPYLKDYPFVQSSDAHYIGDIGAAHSVFQITAPGLSELAMAMEGLNGRKIIHP
jgi:PHP family Zn ribbon phosphoesterase